MGYYGDNTAYQEKRRKNSREQWHKKTKRSVEIGEICSGSGKKITARTPQKSTMSYSSWAQVGKYKCPDCKKFFGVYPPNPYGNADKEPKYFNRHGWSEKTILKYEKAKFLCAECGETEDFYVNDYVCVNCRNENPLEEITDLSSD